MSNARSPETQTADGNIGLSQLCAKVGNNDKLVSFNQMITLNFM